MKSWACGPRGNPNVAAEAEQEEIDDEQRHFGTRPE